MAFVANHLELSTKQGQDRACMPLTTLKEELMSSDPRVSSQAYSTMLDRVTKTTEEILSKEPLDGGKFMDQRLSEIIKAARTVRDNAHPTGTVDWQKMNTQIISLTCHIASLPYHHTWRNVS